MDIRHYQYGNDYNESVDTVYFQYSNRRTTTSVFSQFANEDNLAGIFGIELVRHWYLVLIAVAFGYALFKLYRTPKVNTQYRLVTYYLTYLIVLVAFIPLCVFGMRGGIGRDVRPITISNANQYVNRPAETAIVLNTPFLDIPYYRKETICRSRLFRG